MDPLIGSFIDGKYRILSVLGAGGLGTVYKAEQEDLNRLVAVKVLRLSSLDQDELLARFEREAKVLAGMQHKNIVSVYSYGKLADESPYMVMEYIEGSTLEEILKSSGAKLDWKRALQIMHKVCLATAFVHSCGIVHRDLKPQNIMLVDEGNGQEVKILDFGLSRVRFDGNLMQHLTRTGTILGSVHYMSPEMCQGRKADERSDIYSLGCILYECLSGRTPIDSENPISIIARHVNEAPKPLLDRKPGAAKLDIPEELELIVFKALEKDPENRFASMDDFALALQMVLEGREKELDLGSGLAKLGVSAFGKEKTLYLTLASLAFFLTVFALGFAYNLRQEKVKSESKNSPASLYFEQQERALKLLENARKAQSSGNMARAVVDAKRALFIIARPTPNLRQSSESAKRNLQILKETAQILTRVKSFGSIEDERIDALSLLNSGLSRNESAEYNMYLTRILAHSSFVKDSFFYATQASEYLAKGGMSKELAEMAADLKECYVYDDESAGSEFDLMSKCTLDIVEIYAIASNEGIEAGSRFAEQKLARSELLFPHLDMKRRWQLKWAQAKLLEFLQLDRGCEIAYWKALEFASKIESAYTGQLYATAQPFVLYLRERKRFAEAIKVMKFVEDKSIGSEKNLAKEDIAILQKLKTRLLNGEQVP